MAVHAQGRVRPELCPCGRSYAVPWLLISRRARIETVRKILFPPPGPKTTQGHVVQHMIHPAGKRQLALFGEFSQAGATHGDLAPILL